MATVLTGNPDVPEKGYRCYHVDIASNHCDPCATSKKRMDDDQFARWYERHLPECYKTHDGRAGHNRQM